MEMQEYIIDKALDQIWCNPIQDNQFVVKPARLSRPSGAMVTIFALDRSIPLPWTNSRGHVFQVGQISPSLLGLFERDPSWRKEQWYSFSEAMNTMPLFVNIYNEYGVNIPRFKSYFMFTREKCLLFAIQEDNRLPADLGSDNIYFRFYTNAYLKTRLPPIERPSIQTKGYDRVSINNIGSIISEYNSVKNQAGFVEAYVNGNWVSEISTRSIVNNDIVEWVYEADVKRTVTWTIKKLKPFTSTMDAKSKYILHYPKTTESRTIDLQDDIDIYITAVGPFNTRIGRYYFKNTPDAMRNLTHRDYSIVADYVTFLSEKLAEDLEMVIPDILEFQIFMKIREGGYNRELINDNQRIFELYKLDDYRITMAMSGVETQVPMWHAPNLEASAYMHVVSAVMKDVTIEKVEQAYGYNTIAKILADTPSLTTSMGTLQIGALGYEAALGSTVYEYDASGKMLGYFHHNTSDDDYNPRFPGTRMIEAVIGKGSDEASNYYGLTDIPIPPKCSWRLYHSQMDFSVEPPVPFNNWIDITDTDRYTVTDGKIVWTAPETDQYLCLKTDESFMAYDFDLTQNQGVLIFSLSEYVVKGGVRSRQTMSIAPGDVQLYLNGENLIQEIDYVMNFPYISINSQRSVKQPARTEVQRVHIRMTGFCNPDMSSPLPTETGYVRNGLVSNEGVYHSYSDKITHISVGGFVKAQSQVKFYEDKPGWFPRDPINGRPYQINNVITPLKDFVKTDTYDLLQQAEEIDEAVDGYMNLYWTKPVNEPLSSSEVRWRLTSPFFSCIVELMDSHAWWWFDYERLTDEEVRELCAPYENLLTYDPLSEEHAVPDLYVNITPTREAQPVTITRAQYRVLEQVNKLYGRGLVGLNNFITFTVQNERI